MIKGKYKVVSEVHSNKKTRLLVCSTGSGQGQKGVVVADTLLKVFPGDERRFADRELEVYRATRKTQLKGFLEVQDVFEEGGCTYIALQLQGKSLEALHSRCGDTLTLKTVLTLGLQMLDRIEQLHSIGFLHGDVKPSNFIMGKGAYKHRVFLIDFELSRPYQVDSHTGQEVSSYDMKGQFDGSLRFCSRRVNGVQTVSRIDQIQSLMYTLIFLLVGDLPWNRLNACDLLDAYGQIQQLKQTSRAKLVDGLPPVFKKILENIDTTVQGGNPNYGMIRAELQGQIIKNGYGKDYKYDWQYL